MNPVWVGVDVGKEHHWACVLDAEGRRLLSRRVANDEADLLALLGEMTRLGADQAQWAVDLTTVEAALPLTVLWEHGQSVSYLPGKAVSRAAAGYRSEGRTDAKDARVIADQARMRRDLAELRPTDELVVELRMLTTRRADLVAARTRALNRLRQHLTAVCPALERAASPTDPRAWVVRLSRYQRPKAIRREGADRPSAGEDIAADLVAGLAKEVTDLDGRITELDTAIEARFRRHHQATVITSLPAWDSAWAPSSSPPSATPTCSPRPTSWPPTPDWHRCPTTPANAPAACKGHPLPPRTATSTVHGRPDRHPLLPDLPRLLRQETQRRQTPRPGLHGPGTPTNQRPMGTAARQPALPSLTPDHSPRGLTPTLRLPSGPIGPCLGRLLATGGTSRAVDREWPSRTKLMVAAVWARFTIWCPCST